MVLQRTSAAGDGPYVFLKPKKMRGLGSLRFYTGSNAIIRMDVKRPIVPDTNLSFCLHQGLGQFSKTLNRTGLHFIKTLIHIIECLTDQQFTYIQIQCIFYIYILNTCLSLMCRDKQNPLQADFLGSVNTVSLWCFQNIVLLEWSDRSTYGMSLRRDKVFVQTMEWLKKPVWKR